MKAVILNGFGGPEVMQVGEVPTPEPGKGQIRVRVAATSVNRADTVQRKGNYPPPPGESDILGLEVAGVVDGIGEGVHQWRDGDRVMGLVAGGGYAEYALMYAGHGMAVPESLSLQEAAAISEVYITAHLNLFRIAQLKEDQTVLLHGGGGGVNTAAIQICRTLLPKCRIIVTASPAKIDRVKELGADLVIDYRQQDFAREVLRFTADKGADVILDHIGANYLAANQSALTVGGQLVVIGLMGGAKAEINLGLLLVKRQRLIGSVLRALPVAEKAVITAAFFEQVMPHIRRRTITPVIHRVFPMQEVVQAHQEMESGSHFGKIVMTVGPLAR
ncbi:MAG: NAD(P)H-quinone oxidoreductase [Desulfobacteraceae bacterium]|nr:MAG: NAD(P)H-quinone oxidoreductase [Desulfobacteraceae bacterium]